MHDTLCYKYFQYASKAGKPILQFNEYDDLQSLVYRDGMKVVKAKYFVDKKELKQYVFYIETMNMIFGKAFDLRIVSLLSNCIITTSPYVEKLPVSLSRYKDFMIKQMEKYSCYLYDISCEERRKYSIPDDELVFKSKKHLNILISEVDDPNITICNGQLFIYDATVDRILEV